jgi:membrane-bound lytic murein transglycosylase A
MRSIHCRAALVLLAAGWLSACASVSPPPRAPPPVAPATTPPAAASPGEAAPGPAVTEFAPEDPYASLAGWRDDDHAAAMAVFQAGCAAVRNMALSRVCAEALALGPADETTARAFLERSFRPEPVAGTGLLTAYFAPEYEARTTPGGDFTAPVRRRPADLPAPGTAPYAERSEIEAWPARDALAWMRPEDLFFLQVQGSGTLDFPDGRRSMATSDGTNGAVFIGIAKPMREAGLLADQDTSGEAIRSWLAGHKGPQAKSLMDLDPRYVFFRLRDDDGRDPAGAAGVSLSPGRAVAVDRGRHAMGDLVWIDAEAPTLTGAFPSYRRLVVALDTGGAIKGDVRADLYLGRGAAAGVEAGRVRHQLHLYRLVPVDR